MFETALFCNHVISLSFDPSVKKSIICCVFNSPYLIHSKQELKLLQLDLQEVTSWIVTMTTHC